MFHVRLNELLDSMGFPEKARPRHLKEYFDGKGYKISLKSFQKWLGGESLPDKNNLKEICILVQRSPTYMLYGEGFEQMFINPSERVVRVEALKEALTSTMLNAYRFKLISLSESFEMDDFLNVLLEELEVPSEEQGLNSQREKIKVSF